MSKGRPPAILQPASSLEAHHWQLLWMLSAASFFEGYDLNIVIFALPHIRHSFGLSQSSAALWLSLVYLGALPAVVLARRADRHGRRRLLLATILGYTMATAATAVAPDVGAFAVCQFAARFFLAAEIALTWSMIAEELPREVRGFGFGWLATMDVLGAGFGSIIYGAVLAPLGVSWRWLYVIATPVLLAVVWLRRSLPESRFYLQVAEKGAWSSWRQIVGRPYRRSLLLVCVLAFLINLTAQALTYVVDFLESQRHLSTTAANLTLVAAGAIAIPTLLRAGSLSDRIGRRKVGCTFTMVLLSGLYLFFFVARGVPGLLGSLTLVYVGTFGAWPAFGAYSSELFPTSLRALSNSTAGAFRVVGQCVSFLVAGVLIGQVGSLPRAVAFLAIGPLLAVVLVVVFFPETKGRRLDDISFLDVPATGALSPRGVSSL